MFMHNFFHVLEQRIGFAHQIQDRQNLLNINMKMNGYFKSSIYFKVGEVGFIHRGNDIL